MPSAVSAGGRRAHRRAERRALGPTHPIARRMLGEGRYGCGLGCGIGGVRLFVANVRIVLNVRIAFAGSGVDCCLTVGERTWQAHGGDRSCLTSALVAAMTQGEESTASAGGEDGGKVQSVRRLLTGSTTAADAVYSTAAQEQDIQEIRSFTMMWLGPDSLLQVSGACSRASLLQVHGRRLNQRGLECFLTHSTRLPWNKVHPTYKSLYLNQLTHDIYNYSAFNLGDVTLE